MTPTAFDPTGPLPSAGTWVLEASAGTGKTYTIAALAARYVAEGRPIADLMIVTFSRAATAELRDRVRGRLAGAEAALRARLAGGPDDPDVVNRHLCAVGDAEATVRLERVTAALADLDNATIATTHEFCGRMLDGLGVLADRDPLAEGVDQVDDLVREVAGDLWLRKFSADEAPAFGWPTALAIATRVVEHADEPVPPADPAQQVRLDFAAAVRRQVAQRKRERGLLTYDDLLTGLRSLVRGVSPSTGEPVPGLADSVRARLRARFPVVLVDEFQDTDPVQWDIVREAFVGHSTVVLIGDPKQAIYAFRGADVHCYLQAVGSGDHHLTLATNWRSDAPLLEALDHVLGGTALGDERIMVRPVGAAHGPRLRSTDPERARPLRLRVLPTGEARGQRQPRIATLRRRINADLVAEVRALLDGSTTLTLDGSTRPVRASDVAVLVKSHRTAADVREALAAAGVPAVHTGATSVFAPDNPASRDWATLLRALESVRGTHIRELALTDFVGWTFPQLAEAGDDALNDLSARVRGWARVLDRHGVAALMEAMTAEGLAVRLLASPDGDRRWTDLRHIGQALHEARTRDRLGIAGLIEWLSDRRRDAANDSDDRTRRLETDEDAVAIMTVHGAKGLEFPFVLLPDRWDQYEPEGPGEVVRFRDDTGAHRLWIAGPGRQARDAFTRSLVETRDEALRLLYVALTRAQCQVVAWWAANERNTPASALHRVLHRGGRATPEPAYAWDHDPSTEPVLDHPLIHVSEVVDATAKQGRPAHAAPDPHGGLVLHERTFERSLDTDWRRTSYSGLTAAAHDAAPHPGVDDALVTRVADEPEDGADDADDPLGPPPVAPAGAGAPAATGLASPMAGLPRGADFGTLVHAVYETFDPGAPDVTAELQRVAGHWLARLPLADLGAAQLAEALTPTVVTPLGPIAGGLRLVDVPACDRLPELDFEYPLGGGESPRASTATLADVAELLRTHLDPGDPLGAYAERLGDPLVADQALRGYLIGSIDAVLRVPDPVAGHRYLVVDYKTNWLGPMTGDVPLLVQHYAPDAMARAMMDAHYPLQALVYAVALHRYLRWRQPGYDPGVHLGGVAYLFVRGMAGPATPVDGDGTPHGVFTWRPPAALVVALSDLIDRGTTEEAR